MPVPLDRRSFLQHAMVAPFLASTWTKSPPAGYLAELSALMRAAPVPGAVIGALQNFKLSWIAPLGLRAAGSDDPVTPSTLFHGASLTKQITAYVAFALHGQGKLDLDRPLVNYVNDLRDPGARKVTTRHVLSHSSGFPNWRFARPSEPVPDLVPAFPPGSRYQYSGEGFFYLQRVLEEVSGTGLGQLCHDAVFKPLGMASTTLVWDPGTLSRSALPHDRRGELTKNPDRRARTLLGYAQRIAKPVAQLRYDDYTAALREAGEAAIPNSLLPNAASSLVTSAEDYAAFLAAALRNPLLSQEQVRINEFLGWGLGWGIERASGHTYVFQWGDNPGFKNIVLAEPSNGSAVFVFTNGDAGARVYDRVLTNATGHDHPVLFWL